MILFRQLLFLHWKAVRFGLLPFVLMAFGLPLLSVQGLTPSPEEPLGGTVLALRTLSALQLWLPLYPLLAALLGMTLALSAWNWDHKGEHVYALSLPLPRWRYVLLKLGGGALLLLVPVFAFWLGALLATASIPIPEGLRAYPTALAFRFLLASLVFYALLFALGAGTLRTAIWIILGFLALWIAGGAAADLVVRSFFPEFGPFSLLEWLGNSLLRWPGPFEVLTGSWMLIDV